jgi:hypothetical protein
MSEQPINYPPRKRKPDNVRGETTRDVNAATRVQHALKLKLQGLNWDEVAAAAGYASRGAAHHAAMRELDRCITRDATELRDQQLYMLLSVQARCYKAAMDEKDKNWMWAADRVMNYSKRISELMGLDIPIDQTINQNFTVVREIPQGWLAPVEATTT